MAGLTPDLAAFLTRVVRLDPDALVRVFGGVAWARLPWDVLVTRTVAGSALDGDRTVAAGDWLGAPTADPATLRRRDTAWRAPLPPMPGSVAETLPTAAIRRLSAAAAETLRETEMTGLHGRPVGQRVLRDALLDHIAIVVTTEPGGERVDVPQRLVQAMTRVDLLGADGDPVSVMRAGALWVGLSSAFGAAWWRRPGGLTLTPV